VGVSVELRVKFIRFGAEHISGIAVAYLSEAGQAFDFLLVVQAARNRVGRDKRAAYVAGYISSIDRPVSLAITRLVGSRPVSVSGVSIQPESRFA